MDEIFGFSTGSGTQQNFHKAELEALWNIIAGKERFKSSRAKSAQIRNPAIRYFHKSIASTFFARKVTGTVNESELQMMDLALLEGLNYTRGDRAFKGDTNDAGLTMVLLEQFMWCRDSTTRLHRSGKKTELTIGGIVTPLLVAAGVNLRSEPEEPVWLDLANLAKQQILETAGTNEGFIYKFTHPEVGKASIILPNSPLTTIRLGANIDFCPPISCLYNPATAPMQEDKDEDEPGTEFEPECYFFEDEPTAKTLKEANRRISLLQKFSKWQIKTVNTMKSTVQDLADTVKVMKKQIKRLKRKTKGSSSQASTGPHLQKSGSFSFRPRMSVPIDPPRRSAMEPRERKRRAVPKHYPGKDSTSQLEMQTEPSFRRSDSMSQLVIQPELYFQQPPGSTSQLGIQLESSSRADYTRESMEESITSFFTQH